MNIQNRPSSSRISGFHKMSSEERLSLVESFAGLDAEATAQLASPGNLDPDIAGHMIENAIGTISIRHCSQYEGRRTRRPGSHGNGGVVCHRRGLQFIPPVL